MSGRVSRRRVQTRGWGTEGGGGLVREKGADSGVSGRREANGSNLQTVVRMGQWGGGRERGVSGTRVGQ